MKKIDEEFLDKNEKVEEAINEAWKELTDAYYKMCIEDEQLCNIKDQIEHIESVISFDIKDWFQKYAYTANEGDEQFEEDIHEYDPEAYEIAEYIGENADELRQDLVTRMNELKTKRFVIAREAKIKKIEEDIKYLDETERLYNSCMEKQKLKEEYLKTKKDLYESLKSQYNTKIRDYALISIKKAIEKYPYLVKNSHTSIFTSSDYKRSFNSEILNDIFNEMRKELYLNEKSKSRNK